MTIKPRLARSPKSPLHQLTWSPSTKASAMSPGRTSATTTSSIRPVTSCCGSRSTAFVDIGSDRKAHGLVIGSNACGLIYVAGPDGTVYRTRTASLDEPELDKVADDLRQFLEQLERSLARFKTDGDPGYL